MKLPGWTVGQKPRQHTLVACSAQFTSVSEAEVKLEKLEKLRTSPLSGDDLLYFALRYCHVHFVSIADRLCSAVDVIEEQMTAFASQCQALAKGNLAGVGPLVSVLVPGGTELFSDGTKQHCWHCKAQCHISASPYLK